MLKADVQLNSFEKTMIHFLFKRNWFILFEIELFCNITRLYCHFWLFQWIFTEKVLISFKKKKPLTPNFGMFISH